MSKRDASERITGAHEFVTTPRDVEIERFGDVAALEMALGLWGRKPERT